MLRCKRKGEEEQWDLGAVLVWEWLTYREGVKTTRISRIWSRETLEFGEQARWRNGKRQILEEEIMAS